MVGRKIDDLDITGNPLDLQQLQIMRIIAICKEWIMSK